MKRLIATTIALLAVAVTVIGCTSYGSMYAARWETLIDGTSGMENWNIAGGDGNWRAVDDSIQADRKTTQGATVLVSKKSYKDFELYTEFWASEDTNSGVYIRAPNPNLVTTATGAYEVQIWDKNPNPAYSTGSLVNVAAVQPIYKAGGRWNTFEIYARGPEITVKMNGVVTVSARDSRSLEGRIGLQFNGGPIKFRKLAVREL